MNTIYLQTMTSEKVGLVIQQNNEVKQVSIDRTSFSSVVGTIYIGRVKRIDHGLQAAFVDIGHKKLAFLPKKEVPLSRENPKLSIENLLHEGMNLIVQVVKDPFDHKGARITANVTLPGHYFIYLPFGNYFAASKKMNDQDKEQLKSMIREWSTGEEGAILRTSATQAEQRELKNEWDLLQRKWMEITDKAKKEKPPQALFVDREIPDRFLRKYATNQVTEVICDEVELVQEMKIKYPHLQSKIKWTDNIEKAAPVSIPQLLATLTNKTVKLSSGIELVIEKTEALTVIDVNTATYSGKWNKEQTVLGANLEAAKEAAKQIRLRNLSGIILIDFIDMKRIENHDQVWQEMKKQCQQDPTFCQVIGFTNLGILEMTRKREGVDLYSILCQPSRREWTALSFAYQLERELLSYRRQDHAALVIEVNPDVLEQFLLHIDINRFNEYMKIPIYVEKKTLGERQFVIKFIGDLNWLQHSGSTAVAIDKLI
ncbi:Rne/Rng family ribonuclease [Salinibacillus xinjiangensis]|uniref:Rne/Rng family ribonuclease n=1 Tax=Salinibacillus xinjiangensis TaxID=1229268 RepID=UPI001891C85D|nr:Rne/Rng family ribonuclease [Salinibacillus xinjiangensis]